MSPVGFWHLRKTGIRTRDRRVVIIWHSVTKWLHAIFLLNNAETSPPGPVRPCSSRPKLNFVLILDLVVSRHGKAYETRNIWIGRKMH